MLLFQIANNALFKNSKKNIFIFFIYMKFGTSYEANEKKTKGDFLL